MLQRFFELQQFSVFIFLTVLAIPGRLSDCRVYICRNNQNAEGDSGCSRIDRVINQTGTVVCSSFDGGEIYDPAQATSISSLENKIKSLELQVQQLLNQSSSSSTSEQDLSEWPSPAALQDDDNPVNLTAYADSCVTLIQEKKTSGGAIMRCWLWIEDYCLDQNNIQDSFKYLKRIIKGSYNGERVNVRPTLQFINQLERSSQRLLGFNTLLDSMSESGHYPGKEIFTVALLAGRTFDAENKIWTRFPTAVRLISTLWRLNWFVRYGNYSYALHFADPVNSPLEILTTLRNDSQIRQSNEQNDGNSNQPLLDWHFARTSPRLSSFLLKIVGPTSGYLTVDEETMLLVRVTRGEQPAEFELEMNENLIDFSVLYKGKPIRSRLAFGKPFAFTAHENNHQQGEHPAEFFVTESQSSMVESSNFDLSD